MAPTEGTTINIGEAVRGGLRLTAEEAVALVHEACVKLDAGIVKTLPNSIDQLSVGAEGLVVVLPTGEPKELHTAVAGLLEELLGTLRDGRIGAAGAPLASGASATGTRGDDDGS